MVIVSVLKDEVREGQRKAKGREVHAQTVLGVDNYNLIIGFRTGKSPIVGKAFFGKLEALSTRLEEFGVDPKEARGMIQRDLCKIFGRKFDNDLTFEQLDGIFKLSKLRDDSSGILSIYNKLKSAGLASDS